ncbi:MAG: hypothetical protein ACI4JJ_01960 [Huintestinicola sp.]
MDKLQLFMKVYIYELESYLNENKEKIRDISFQSDEANTDRPLKEYLKQVIQFEFNRISDKISEVTIEYSDSKSNSYCITDEIRSFFIEKALLPDEISDDLKKLLSQRKNAVYTNPDICLKINADGEIFYETVELKSTKNDSIPGSSIQQVSPEEWVIFIKHCNNSVNVTTGMYFHAINAKMQFPDRSPRPQVSFSELESWNQSHRNYNKNTLLYRTGSEDSIKHELLSDWQSVLAKRWTKILFTSEKSQKEPWFNNTLRKFILDFLSVYDTLSDAKKEEYRKMIFSLVEK